MVFEEVGLSIGLNALQLSHASLVGSNDFQVQLKRIPAFILVGLRTANSARTMTQLRAAVPRMHVYVCVRVCVWTSYLFPGPVQHAGELPDPGSQTKALLLLYSI